MAYSSSSSPEISVGPTIDTRDHFSYKLATHDEVLEDLSSRFILNLPDEELASLERICFQVEQAHWFYEDFIREENPKFPSLPLKKFSAMLFHACPLLHQWSHDHEQAFNTFMQYKTRVPVCGAIMLNDTWEKCILVKGWKSSSGWGFPKGKINEHEPPHDCAVREVLEETGYNLAGQIDRQDVIEMSIKEQKISLYIVAGVPEDFHFQTRTRKEISRIEWFKLTDLPTWKRNKAAPGKFYLISPFIGALKSFINERKPRALLRKTPMKPRSTAVPQAVHTRQKQIPSSFSLQSLDTYHDPTAQESSSQSSSADNGDPHTPSPQYSESLANGHIVTAHPEDSMSTDEMDPNLARLLNSLSLSAIDHKDDAKSNVTLLPTSAPPAPATPIPTSIPTASLHPPPDQVDWSSHVPKPLSARPAETLQAPSPVHRGSQAMGPRPLSLRPSQVPQSSLTLSSRPIRTSTPSDNRQRPPTPPSATLSTRSIMTSVSSASSVRKPSSRRTSSTADISPYLSRPSEIPTSGKRLKQLALLETVADESARLTPLLGNRESLRQLGAPINGAQGYQLPTSARHPPVLTPLPPLSNGDTINTSRVLYTSGRGPVPPPSGLPYVHQPRPPFPHQQIYDDPFQVRPRTSQAFQSGSMFSGHSFAGRPPSVHQSQLLSLLSSPRGAAPYLPPPPSQLIGPYPHPVLAPPPPPPPQPPTVQQMSSRGPPPLHVIPHNLYSPHGQPPPVSAPAFSPIFQLPTPANNSSLLSILNGAASASTGNTQGPNMIYQPS